MSPSLWVLAIIVLVALCWLVAWFDEIANGTYEERKAAKRAAKLARLRGLE